MIRTGWKQIGRWMVCLALALPMIAGAAAEKETIRRVMTFYYPWYGTADGPGGAGKTVHWGHIDIPAKDISGSTHYPAGGAYDSHDPQVIRRHCRQAKENGIDTLIVSWWGAGSYEDRAMPRILQACEQFGLKATVYYETVPDPQTPQTAAKDIVENVLNKYAAHPAWLTHHGRPVVFVYGRALHQLGLYGWHQAKQQIETSAPPGAVCIGDDFSYAAAAVFDGLHTYNPAAWLRDKTPRQAESWCARTYPWWIQTARRQGKIAALTVIPGYDDTKIRTPGLKVPRFDGKLYAAQWRQAVKADPDWILITSFNEWYEGSEIEPSVEYGAAFLKWTGQFARQFIQSEPEPRPPLKPALPETVENRLRRKLARLSIAVLPQPSSAAFWWLLNYKKDLKILSWQDIADGKLTPDVYPMALYGGGERYCTTVRQKDDVTAALERYAKQGGTLVVLPSEPWPFYYNEDGQTVNHSARFGITLKFGWELPPPGKDLFFVSSLNGPLAIPDEIPFSAAPDPRWRPFVPDARHSEYRPLIQLRDRRGNDYGDGLVMARLPAGGRVVYGWCGLFRPPHEEPILTNVFLQLAEKIQ